MANLIIDIGNTALKAAWADGMTLGKTFRYQGEKMLDFILSYFKDKTRYHGTEQRKAFFPAGHIGSSR